MYCLLLTESDEELGESSGASSVNEVGAVVLAKCNGYPEWPALVRTLYVFNINYMLNLDYETGGG